MSFASWAMKVAANRLDALKRTVMQTGQHTLPAVHAPAPAAAKVSLKERLAPTVAAKPAAQAAHPAAQAAQAAQPLSVAEHKAMQRGRMAAPAAAPATPVPTVQQLQSRTANRGILQSAAQAQALGVGPAASPLTPRGALARPIVAPPPSIMAPAQRLQAGAAQAAHVDPAALAEENRLAAIAALAKHAKDGSDGAVMRKMEHAGIPICIETDVGQARTWKDPKTGEDRATIMRFPYGYIPDTEGMDDGSVDVFVGPVSDAPNAYVILINKPPTFDAADEEKVFLGFTNVYDAIGAFLQHYGNQEKFIRKVSVIPVAELAKSLKESGKTGTPEGATKTDTRAKKEPELEVDPTSSIVEALEKDASAFASKVTGEDPAEDAYWRFDARRAGTGPWKHRPQSERDAFKAEWGGAPAVDESAVKTAAAYLTAKIASQLPQPVIDEDAVRSTARYFAAKIAAEPAATSIAGFAPYNVTTETAGPDTPTVNELVPDGTVYDDQKIEDLFRSIEANAMQTDHIINPGDIAGVV